ncbi:hypothetical protein GCM10010425_03500 [Streptomyces spororaveus]|uniref:Uncharacterized protein n=1 Tax=Streptomyces spororaveus TaxID=284039 RepID=A0ABQ3TD74_9ACTN|nr:hypothetical protein Sspor_39290 [Streptomyces spororaveus]
MCAGHVDLGIVPLRPATREAQTRRTEAHPGGEDFVNFWPIYTGQTIPMGSWHNRMWLDTWV